MRPRLSWLVLGLCLAGPNAAFAQAAAAPASPSAQGEASAAELAERSGALINAGIQARKAGDDRAALQAFEQAYGLTGSGQAGAQMALAEQALGRWLDARSHLERALQQASDPWILQHGATLRAALEEIDSRLGLLEVSCNVAGAGIYLDDRELGRTPLAEPVRIVAGQSVLKVAARGYFDVVRQVQVDPRGLSRVDITLTSNAEEPSTRPARDAAASTSRDSLLYASIGLAALGVSAGVTGYVIREINVGLYNDDSHCAVRADVPRSDECPRESDAWRRGETIAIAGFAAAGVFGGLGLYLWLDKPSAARAPGVACAVGALGASCRGAF